MASSPDIQEINGANKCQRLVMIDPAFQSATNTIRAWVVKKRIAGRALDHAEIVGEVVRRWPDKPAGVADQIAKAADAGAWATVASS